MYRPATIKVSKDVAIEINAGEVLHEGIQSDMAAIVAGTRYPRTGWNEHGLRCPWTDHVRGAVSGADNAGRSAISSLELEIAEQVHGHGQRHPGYGTPQG
ncbi:hypothetical protein GCM10009577_37220 [Streptomyces javensis]